MATETIDWTAHVDAYRTSGLALPAYCKAAGVKLSTFRYYVYKNRPRATSPTKSAFQEVPVARELVISRAPNGELSLGGLEIADLLALIKAWSHAL